MPRLLSLLLAFLWFALPLPALAEPLPGTKPLEEKGDLARIMVDGIHKYLDRELAAAPKKRDELWKADLASKEALAKSLPAKRERLKKTLGVVDERVKPNLEYVSGTNTSPLLVEIDGCKVYSVRWAVLPGVDAEGLLIEPKGEAKANVVAVGPPQTAGPHSFALIGCRVLWFDLVNREDALSGNSKLKRQTNLPHREFVYRMAYEMGRTLTGYELQKVLAAVDWFKTSYPKLEVGLIGNGDGGMVVQFAGALDDRIKAAGVGGYFGPREQLHEEPIDRNVWGLLREFGDAELARLHPTGKVYWDHRQSGAIWGGPSTAQPGRSGAAPGKLKPVALDDVLAEEARFTGLKLASEKISKGDDNNAVRLLASELGLDMTPFKIDHGDKNKFELFKRFWLLKPSIPIPNASASQFNQLVAFTQKLWRDSDATRKEFWKKADSSSPAKWEASCEWYREYFHSEVIGKLPEPTKPLNVRTRQTYDEKNWTGHEVVMDVYDDVIAYGILLLPKDMKPGEKRPVIVCQHGLEGRPTDIVNPKENTRYYNSYGAKLADLGHIVYAPQNPYIFQNHFRQIQRKANPLKLSLFSFIIRQHQRTLDWLETLPQVDAKKIAFYGLSYGGKTAMRVPAVEKRYCLSICSGDFNEWIGKNVSVDLDRSYMWTGEYEMYEFDLGNTFNYAEMAYLIAPRPFMVERGHDDGVGTDEMVAWEYAKVRYLYANRLKLPDRAAIDFQPGGHEIFLKGTLEFLQKHIGKAR